MKTMQYKSNRASNTICLLPVSIVMSNLEYKDMDIKTQLLD